jgi:hypothetical protein
MPRGKNWMFFNVRAGGIYSNQCGLKGYVEDHALCFNNQYKRKKNNALLRKIFESFWNKSLFLNSSVST